MKTIHFLIAMAALAGVSFGAASVKNPATIHMGNSGKAYPLLRESLDSGAGGGAKPYLIHLDTAEIDTGYILFNVLTSPIHLIVDTLGTVSITCKDSTGTDTSSVVLKWQGNPRCDGRGTWENVDSVTYIGATTATANAPTPASSSYSNKRAYVVNTGGFCLYKFYARNKLVGAVGQKPTCKDALLIERERVGVRP